MREILLHYATVGHVHTNFPVGPIPIHATALLAVDYLRWTVLTGLTPVVPWVGRQLKVMLTNMYMLKEIYTDYSGTDEGTFTPGIKSLVIVFLVRTFSRLLASETSTDLTRNRSETITLAVFIDTSRLTLPACLAIDMSTTPTTFTFVMSREKVVVIMRTSAIALTADDTARTTLVRE